MPTDGYNPKKEYWGNVLGWSILAISMIAIFVTAVIQFSVGLVWTLLGGIVIGLFLVSLVPTPPNR